MRFLLPILLPAALSGCAVRPAEVTPLSEIARITDQVPRDRTAVFVHLPASANTLNAKVTVDGKVMAELPKRSFTMLTLRPGAHTIDMKFPVLTGPNCEDYRFVFERGMVYHLALNNGPGTPSLVSLAVNEFLYSAAHLRPVHAMDGIQLSRYETYVAAPRD